MTGALLSRVCDADNVARAYAAVEVAGVDLHFCAHHFTKHEAALRSIAPEDGVLDERHVLAGEVRR